MKYMLLIHHEEKAFDNLSEDQRKQLYADHRKYGEEITASGNYVTGSKLQPTTTASSVRVRDGQRLVTDGPFAETREQLGGYYLVEARDLDEALNLAARIPSARLGTVEVRPLAEMATPAAT